VNSSYKVAELLTLSEENWKESVSSPHKFSLYLHRLRDLEYRLAQEITLKRGISLTEFDILASLRRYSSPYSSTPAQLQSATLLTSGGLTKVLHQLESKKLVYRSIHPKDKRSKLVHLTPEGKAKAESLMDELNTMVDNLLTKVFDSDEKKKSFISSLGDLLTVLESDPSK